MASSLLLVGAALLIMAVEGGSSNSTSILSSLRYFDELASSENYTRVHNLDVYNDESVSICRMVDFSPLRDDDQLSEEQVVAAISLALQHLNTADDSVVRDLRDQDCGDLKFTAEFLGSSGLEVMDSVMQTLLRETKKPCIFTGSSKSDTTLTTAALTSVHGYPQVTTMPVSSRFENFNQYPLLSSLSASPETAVIPLLDYLHDTFQLPSLIVVHPDDPSITSAVEGIKEYSVATGLIVDYIMIPTEDSTMLSLSIQSIKNIGSYYVLNMLEGHDFEQFMATAYSMGAAGENYVWISTSPSIANESEREFAPNDPYFLASRGVVHYGDTDIMLQRDSAFGIAWKDLADSEEDVEYIRALVPTPHSGHNTTLGNATQQIALIYDMAILAGLSACRAEAPFPGEEHHGSMLTTSFAGASGFVSFGRVTGERDVGTQQRVIRNLQPRILENGNYKLEAIAIASFDADEWHSYNDIVFNDGTTTRPAVLSTLIVNHNYVGLELRMIGCMLALIIMGTSAYFAIWTLLGRDRSRVIRAAQPTFLLLICLGTAMMGSSVIPLAIDDELVANPPCMAFPWLLSLGWCFAFSALFSKTMRVNKIFHNPSFTRVRVSARDVMVPMSCLMCVNVCVLLGWSVMSPVRWNRKSLALDRFNRVTDSIGTCQYDDSDYVFTTFLAIVNLSALVLANHQSYVARKISTEFSETDYLARAMSLIITTAFIAIPIGVLASDNTQASLFVQTGFVFVVCMSLLLFIFVPKLFYKPEQNSMTRAIRSSMVTSGSIHAAHDTSESGGDKIIHHPSLTMQMHKELIALRQEKSRWQSSQRTTGCESLLTGHQEPSRWQSSRGTEEASESSSSG